MYVVLWADYKRALEAKKCMILTWKFHGSDILSSSLGGGGTTSEGGLFGIGGDLGPRFANLKKPDFLCLAGGGSAGEHDLADAAEETSDADDRFMMGEGRCEYCELGERGECGGIDRLSGESDASDLF
jgi:hypothetical protein